MLFAVLSYELQCSLRPSVSMFFSILVQFVGREMAHVFYSERVIDEDFDLHTYL